MSSITPEFSRLEAKMSLNDREMMPKTRMSAELTRSEMSPTLISQPTLDQSIHQIDIVVKKKKKKPVLG